MPKGVTLDEIEQIFVILERLGISREAVVIPLRPTSPGGVRRQADGKIEILVDAQQPFSAWLSTLEPALRAVTGS